MKQFLIIILLQFSYSAFAQTPTIFWASDPVKPNETILAQGDMLDGDTKLEIIQLENKEVKNKPKLKQVNFSKFDKLELDSKQPSSQTGKYIIPKDWKQGIYAIRPVRNGVAGKVKLINAPKVWWSQGNEVEYTTPSSEFGIYGNCLSYGNAKVILKGENGKYHYPTIKEQDLWHISLALENQNEGNYEIFVHNGLGGDYGWVAAGQLTVKSKAQWPQKIFNVVDYGAKPNFDPSRSRLDKTNDSPAFQRALDAAGENGGGVVFIPNGCYQLVEELYVPRFVTIRGESQLSTNLGWTDKNEPPLGLINGTNSFAVEDLTIFVQNYWSIIRGDHGHAKDAGNISVQRVTIRANRNIGIMDRYHHDKWKDIQIERRWNVKRREAPLFFGGENIKIIDCDILASHNSIIIDKASGIIANNKLHCPQTFQASQYWIRGCNKLIMTNNDIYGGGCMGTHNTSRGIYRQDDWEVKFNPYSRNVYFSNNYQHDNWKFDREMMTLDSHGYAGPYLGPVEKTEKNTFTIPERFPVLSIAGEMTHKSGGPIFSKIKLKEGEEYKIIVKLESKADAMDWDRSFVNFYDIDEEVETTEPEMYDRNGDNRHYGHGKISAVKVLGDKSFEVVELRTAKTWEALVSEDGHEKLFVNTTPNKDNTPSIDKDNLFSFDEDGELFVMLRMKMNKYNENGLVRFVKEDGRSLLDVGLRPLGGNKVNFENAHLSSNQSSRNINLFKGAFVYVIEGKGCGQYRKIVDGKDRTIVLDKDWDVELDETSVISIHRTHDHQIFTHNRFEDGGAAMLLYSGSVENIVAKNTTTRASGFIVTGLVACVPMYCQFLDNEIVTGAGLGGPPFNLRGGRLSVEPYRPIGYHNGYQTIGVVMRGNKLNSLASMNISGPVQNVLIENNAFQNTESAIIVNSEGMGSFEKSWYWPEDVYIRNNTLENVQQLLKSDKEAKVKVEE